MMIKTSDGLWTFPSHARSLLREVLQTWLAFPLKKWPVLALPSVLERAFFQFVSLLCLFEAAG